ncbi:hypothetical protein BD779DRAFT_1554056 [Infundibulicybe gibba]|nr:hypothetical protein BD779DRAFT_1554056 [Infundibulicybe gibba]
MQPLVFDPYSYYARTNRIQNVLVKFDLRSKLPDASPVFLPDTSPRTLGSSSGVGKYSVTLGYLLIIPGPS